MQRYRSALSVALGIGLVVTYMLAMSKAIDLKAPASYMSEWGNTIGLIGGWISALIATGTFVGAAFALDTCERENEQLKRRVAEIETLYYEEMAKRRN